MANGRRVSKHKNDKRAPTTEREQIDMQRCTAWIYSAGVVGSGLPEPELEFLRRTGIFGVDIRARPLQCDRAIAARQQVVHSNPNRLLAQLIEPSQR